jgi:hypothetical protein
MQVDLLSSLQAKPFLIDWLNLIQFLVFTQKDSWNLVINFRAKTNLL